MISKAQSLCWAAPRVGLKGEACICSPEEHPYLAASQLAHPAYLKEALQESEPIHLCSALRTAEGYWWGCGGRGGPKTLGAWVSVLPRHVVQDIRTIQKVAFSMENQFPYTCWALGHPLNHKWLGDHSTWPWLKSLQWDLHLYMNNPLFFPSSLLTAPFLSFASPNHVPGCCSWSQNGRFGRDLKDGPVAQRDQLTARGHLLVNGKTEERS